VIRRVAYRQDSLQPAGAAGDWATVHPDVEAGAATVCTGATLADATEWQSRDVQGSVIAGDTTGAGTSDNYGIVRISIKRKKGRELTLCNIGLVAEWVETQWGGLDAVCQVNGLVDVLNGQNRDEGAEALLSAH